jgi:hypothetical protein
MENQRWNGSYYILDCAHYEFHVEREGCGSCPSITFSFGSFSTDHLGRLSGWLLGHCRRQAKNASMHGWKCLVLDFAYERPVGFAYKRSVDLFDEHGWKCLVLDFAYERPVGFAYKRSVDLFDELGVDHEKSHSIFRDCGGGERTVERSADERVCYDQHISVISSLRPDRGWSTDCAGVHGGKGLGVR